MIANLDELALGCADENARTNIGEAIKCYQSGAYRAAIVNAYVAVCFDLIEKLKTLAATGDSVAKQEESKLQRLQQQNDENNPQAIKGLLEFERGLLELFRDKFDFFGRNEFDELNRLREDRNRCAHPTFSKSAIPFPPSAELARLHIRNALVHVLTQHPKQGRAAVANLENTVVSQYFPKKVSDAVIRLQETELKNARPALVDAFLDRLCFGSTDENSPLYKKRCAQIAAEAMVEMFEPQALPRLTKNVGKLLKDGRDDAVYVGCLFAFRTPEAAEGINDAEKTVVKAWVQAPTPGTSLGPMMCRGLSISWLRSTIIEQIPVLSASDLGKIKFETVPPEILSHAAEVFASSKSWSQANRFADQFAIKFAPKFSDENLEFIFNETSSRRADLRGSSGFHQFLETLFEESSDKKAAVCNMLIKHNLENYLPDDEFIA